MTLSISLHMSKLRQQSVGVVRAVTPQQKGPGFNSVSVWSFHVLPVSLQLLQPSESIQETDA